MNSVMEDEAILLSFIKIQKFVDEEAADGDTSDSDGSNSSSESDGGNCSDSDSGNSSDSDGGNCSESDGGNNTDSCSSDEKKSDSKPESDSGPEWGFDSYDESDHEYISEPEDRRYFDNEEEYQQYRFWRIQGATSKGFLGDPFHNVFVIEGKAEAFATSISTILSLCIERFNKENGKTVEFVSVERVSMRTGCIFKFYITFMARECPDGDLVEYQAKGLKYVGPAKRIRPILCRPSPHKPTI